MSNIQSHCNTITEICDNVMRILDFKFSIILISYY